ncbi:MAG: acyl-ACP--UDP-N-acetylglucosamine O-acyltransferase [Phycisphaerales bacterium]|nr:acyl-ACP--UDP-N-acetylglucosamine O-acyltransferase [Phycisphaerales bacterium]
MPKIHPTAIVDDQVKLAEDVEIGPYCVLNGDITLGAGVHLIASVHMQGPLTVGSGSVFYPGSSMGFGPQDAKIKYGDPTAGTIIGSDCVFRESSSVHAASNDHTPTRVGDRAFFMVNAHVGHDVQMGSDVVLVVGAGVGGHAEIQDRVILSGATMVHHFGRVGRQAMTSGLTILSNDLPPYFMAAERNKVVGLNLVGMKRSGMSRDEIAAVRSAYSEVFRKKPPMMEMRQMLAERAKESKAVDDIYQFILESKRAICPVGGRNISRTTSTQSRADANA